MSVDVVLKTQLVNLKLSDRKTHGKTQLKVVFMTGGVREFLLDKKKYFYFCSGFIN